MSRRRGHPQHPQVPLRPLHELAEEYGLANDAGSWVASAPAEGDYHRRRGFREAGRLLLERGEDAQLHYQLIYPALTVYRHYFELQLKELVRLGDQVHGRPPEAHLGHRLPVLLDTVASAIEVVWPDEMDELNAARLAISFLDELDPSAQVVRYSVLTDGQPSIPSPGFLDARETGILLGEGAKTLEAAEMGISVWLDQRAEFASYAEEGA